MSQHRKRLASAVCLSLVLLLCVQLTTAVSSRESRSVLENQILSAANLKAGPTNCERFQEFIRAEAKFITANQLTAAYLNEEEFSPHKQKYSGVVGAFMSDAQGAIKNAKDLKSYTSLPYIVPRENAYAALALIRAAACHNSTNEAFRTAFIRSADRSMDVMQTLQIKSARPVTAQESVFVSNGDLDGSWYLQYDGSVPMTNLTTPDGKPDLIAGTAETALVIIAMSELGVKSRRVESIRSAANFLIRMQNVNVNKGLKGGQDDGLLARGLTSLNQIDDSRCTFDNVLGYTALKQAEYWERVLKNTDGERKYRDAADLLLNRMATYLVQNGTKALWNVCINGSTHEPIEPLGESWKRFSATLFGLPDTFSDQLMKKAEIESYINFHMLPNSPLIRDDSVSNTFSISNSIRTALILFELGDQQRAVDLFQQLIRSGLHVKLQMNQAVVLKENKETPSIDQISGGWLEYVKCCSPDDLSVDPNTTAVLHAWACRQISQSPKKTDNSLSCQYPSTPRLFASEQLTQYSPDDGEKVFYFQNIEGGWYSSPLPKKFLSASFFAIAFATGGIRFNTDVADLEHARLRCLANPTTKQICSDQGTCLSNVDRSRAACVCEDAYYSPTCALACPVAVGSGLTCNGYGTCRADGTCRCRNGFVGPACDLTCPGDPPCSNKGICLSSGTCGCQSGYSGSDCSDINDDIVRYSTELSLTNGYEQSAQEFLSVEGTVAAARRNGFVPEVSTFYFLKVGSTVMRTYDGAVMFQDMIFIRSQREDEYLMAKTLEDGTVQLISAAFPFQPTPKLLFDKHEMDVFLPYMFRLVNPDNEADGGPAREHEWVALQCAHNQKYISGQSQSALFCNAETIDYDSHAQNWEVNMLP
eukprot:GILK01000898.1.p1 GENE.GILK01000898.1~~GILK01000898.1.p1  ORF type:complete len:884 (-),score=173.42 GILK01000898.1:67-2688(-)